MCVNGLNRVGRQVSRVMVRHLPATLIFLLDGRCWNKKLYRSLWKLHRALFPGDVIRGRKGPRRYSSLLHGSRIPLG